MFTDVARCVDDARVEQKARQVLFASIVALIIFSLLAYLKTANMFWRHSYLIVLFYNVNLGNAHIIRS